jgi:hypothetical protein
LTAQITGVERSTRGYFYPLIVKTAGCAITVIKGRIEPGDDRKFAKVIEANKIEWSPGLLARLGPRE